MLVYVSFSVILQYTMHYAGCFQAPVLPKMQPDLQNGVLCMHPIFQL